MTSTSYRDEQELIADCIGDRPGGWERFIVQYRRLIRSTVYRVSGTQSGAPVLTEDIEAHVYEKLLEDGCRRLRLWKGQARFSTYLVQVTRNLTLDYVKRGGAKPIMEPYDDRYDAPQPDLSLGSEEFRLLRADALRKAIDQLSTGQQLIMQLRLEGKSLREIASMLDRPVGTVSVENSRALEKLRTLIRTNHPELDDPADEENA